MQRTLTGPVGWSERRFWQSTFVGAMRAIDGFAEFHGAKPAPAPAKAKVEDMLLRFPDPPKGRRG